MKVYLVVIKGDLFTMEERYYNSYSELSKDLETNNFKCYYLNAEEALDKVALLNSI